LSQRKVAEAMALLLPIHQKSLPLPPPPPIPPPPGTEAEATAANVDFADEEPSKAGEDYEGRPIDEGSIVHTELEDGVDVSAWEAVWDEEVRHFGSAYGSATEIHPPPTTPLRQPPPPPP